MSLVPKTDQTKYRGITSIIASEPVSPSDGDTWLDSENILRIYSATDSKWYAWNLSVVPYGYIMGGTLTSTYSNNEVSSIDRLTFPFDLGTSKLIGNLSQTKCAMSACNSSSSAYISGGGYLGSPIEKSTIDRFTFPFDSGTSSHSGNLSSTKGLTGGFNSSSHGYICGGYIPSFLTTVVERISFPFEGGATQVGNVYASTYSPASCNDSSYGYNMGTYISGTRYSLIQRLEFPFDSGTMTSTGNLSYTKSNSAGNNSSNYGYCMGGYDNTVTVSVIERISFPWSSGTATHVGNLGIPTHFCSGFNSTDYGYCCGGVTNAITAVQRITFPFGSGSASFVGIMTTSRFQGCGIDGTDFKTQFI